MLRQTSRFLAFVLAFQIGIGGHLPAALAQDRNQMSPRAVAEQIEAAFRQGMELYEADGTTPFGIAEYLEKAMESNALSIPKQTIVVRSKDAFLPVRYIYKIDFSKLESTSDLPITLHRPLPGAAKAEHVEEPFTALLLNFENKDDLDPVEFVLLQVGKFKTAIKRLKFLGGLEDSTEKLKASIDQRKVPSLLPSGDIIDQTLMALPPLVALIATTVFLKSPYAKSGFAKGVGIALELLAVALFTQAMNGAAYVFEQSECQRVFNETDRVLQTKIEALKRDGTTPDIRALSEALQDRLVSVGQFQPVNKSLLFIMAPLVLAFVLQLAGKKLGIAGNFPRALVTAAFVVIIQHRILANTAALEAPVPGPGRLAADINAEVDAMFAPLEAIDVVIIPEAPKGRVEKK